MRRLAGALLVVTLGLGGCAAGRLDPPPRPPAPTPPAPTPPAPCASPTVRVPGVPPPPAVGAEPARPTVERGVPTPTGVQRRHVGAGGVRVEDLLDAPVVPALRWDRTPAGIDPEAVWSELVARADARREPSYRLAEAISPMDGLERRPGTYVTYVGVGRRTIGFTAMCGGELYEGRAETWTFAEGGAVSCALPVADGGALAGRVHADYC